MALNQHKIENYVIIASLKSEKMGILINRIPDSRLLISSLPGSALRKHVESLSKASRCQQAFSKLCLVILVSKDTHLVFYIKGVLKKVSKGAKIRNRYNQVPHLTQDTNGKVTNSQQTPQTRAKRSISPFPAGDHKAHINRHAQRHRKH